jgi:hypothetical protein
MFKVYSDYMNCTIPSWLACLPWTGTGKSLSIVAALQAVVRPGMMNLKFRFSLLTSQPRRKLPLLGMYVVYLESVYSVYIVSLF